MTVLVEVWKRYAGQIEADLLRQGIDIGDWHTGRMSSRRLMVLLKYPLEDDWFSRDFVRGGRQSRSQRVHEEALNEALRLRASYEAVASQGEVRWDANDFAWRDPRDEIEIAKRRAEEEAEREDSQQELFDELGFT